MTNSDQRESIRGAAAGRTTLTLGALVLVLALVLTITGTAAAEDGDAGSAITVEVTDGSTPTPTPVAPAPQPELAGLAVDGSSFVIGGTSVAVGRSIPSTGIGLAFTRGSYRVEISGRDAQGVSLRVDSDGNLIVDSGGSLFVRGSGFRASTPVAVYLYSSPTLLGQLTTDSSGSFSGSFAIPAGTAVGVHNVQVVGTLADGEAGALTAGLRIYATEGSAAAVTAPVSRGGNSGSGTPTVQQTPVSDAEGDGLDDQPGTLDLGVFSMSALHASVEPSLALTGGTVNLFFTVRNSSTSVFDATARFWLDGAFGPPIAAIDGVAVAGLQPGEARRITASFENVGNWVFYRGFVTFTPPEVVDNTELVPVTREVDVIVPPPAALPAIGLLAVAALAIVIWLIATGRLWLLLGWRRRDDDDEPPAEESSPAAPQERELATSGVRS